MATDWMHCENGHDMTELGHHSGGFEPAPKECLECGAEVNLGPATCDGTLQDGRECDYTATYRIYVTEDEGPTDEEVSSFACRVHASRVRASVLARAGIIGQSCDCCDGRHDLQHARID